MIEAKVMKLVVDWIHKNKVQNIALKRVGNDSLFIFFEWLREHNILQIKKRASIFLKQMKDVLWSNSF